MPASMEETPWPRFVFGGQMWKILSCLVNFLHLGLCRMYVIKEN